MKEQDLTKQISFLMEIDKLKSVQRRTKLLNNSRYENSAEHSWHLGMMALLLSSHANTEHLNILKVIKMALIHDIVEIDAGDTFAYDVKGNEDKQERELKAANRLYGLLPKEQADEFYNLWLEYENRNSDESKFVAALDKLQPLIHNYHTNGETWQKYGITSDKVLNRNKDMSKGSKILWEYAEELIQKAVIQGILPKE